MCMHAYVYMYTMHIYICINVPYNIDTCMHAHMYSICVCICMCMCMYVFYNFCQHTICLCQHGSFGIGYVHSLKHKGIMLDVVIAISMVGTFTKLEHREGIRTA